MNRFLRIASAAGAVLCMACASPSYIDIAYRIPAASSPLAGKTVQLAVEDARYSPDIFTPAAAAQFENFTGIFALTLVQGTERYVDGTYSLPGLFQKALERRLQALGLTVVPVAGADQPALHIVLKQFLLDLSGRDWIADIQYEARLMSGERLLASETVSGSAERLKLVGAGSGETVLGEIFTDSINKLDIQGLFRKAGLRM